jgi:hypothetical protein
MRMRANVQDERGAVAVMVGLAMVAFLGLLALTLDFGRAVGVRRDMVNAADAAALAAAQECAAGHGPAAAISAADVTASLNDAPNPGVIELDPECVSGTLTTEDLKSVTVTYSKVLDYYVAPMLGFDNVTIRTTATAVWGPAQGFHSPVPIRITATALGPCIGHEPPYAGPGCAFAFDNTDENSAAASQWAVLNFPEGWPQPAGSVGPTDCQSNAGGTSDTVSYIEPGTTPFGFDATVPEDPGYVYVCAAPGELGQSVIDALIDRANSSDPYLVFPVMSDSVPPVLTPSVEAYPIVGFSRLRILGAWKGHEARAHCTFPDGVNDSSLFCIQTQWDGGSVGGFLPGTGLSFGTVNAVRLVK